jgi:plastocyanin
MPYTKQLRQFAILIVLGLTACVLLAENGAAPVSVRVEVDSPKAAKKPAVPRDPGDASNIVIWLSPLTPAGASSSSTERVSPRITQINKSFDPHVLVIQVGTPVEFPNRDPFLHNVFSLFDGKRFDLGFYEAGSSKTVHFDRPGVSYLFCNIHPEMSGAVVAVDTPYFGLSDRNGRVSIANVPDGKYQLNVWYERSLPEDLKSAGRTVTISESARTLDTVHVVENPNFSLDHKNKYGQDYVPPSSSSPVYHP